MSFPVHRLRRLRGHPTLRAMLRRSRVQRDQLVYPMFVVEGRNVCEPVAGMPGVARRSIDRLAVEARALAAQGLRAVILFGLPAQKDEVGSGAYAADGIVQRALAALREQVPPLVLIADTCLCEYTDHGHCGVLQRGTVENDATLDLLARAAVSQAAAGAHVVAPSDMMDGRVGAIRRALDVEGFADTPIMSYAAKYASAFYGPFREAADSAPREGDRRGYQMDPAGGLDEALREVELDLEEGADIVLVKPALPCLDVIAAVRARFRAPVAAYHVSGEYAMIKAAAANGWLDEDRAVMESMLALRRAGADLIVTYHAPRLLELLDG